jgi:hypothetical protein
VVEIYLRSHRQRVAPEYVHNFGIGYAGQWLWRTTPKLQSRYLGPELGEIFAVHRDHESTILLLKSGAEVDVQVRRYLVETDRRCDGYISSELPQTRIHVSDTSHQMSQSHMLTSGIISAGSVTSRWASSSLKEMRWAISTSQ